MVRGEVSAPRAGSCGQHELEIGRTLHAAEHRCRRRPQRSARRSDRRQALAALGAPCVDHGAATARLHPREETMRAGAADFRGLIGAFHGVSVSSGPASSRRRGGQASSGTDWHRDCAAGLNPAGRFCRGGPLKARDRHDTLRLQGPAFAQRSKPFGKPRIKARIPFSVKHLHGSPCLCRGIDRRTRTVDNHAWRAGSDLQSRRSEKNLSTNERRPLATRLRTPRCRTPRTAVQHLDSPSTAR